MVDVLTGTAGSLSILDMELFFHTLTGLNRVLNQIERCSVRAKIRWPKKPWRERRMSKCNWLHSSWKEFEGYLPVCSRSGPLRVEPLDSRFRPVTQIESESQSEGDMSLHVDYILHRSIAIETYIGHQR